jgi:hypothetical protein
VQHPTLTVRLLPWGKISQMIHNGVSWKRVQAELEKCDVVCANDRRRRTAAATFGWYRAMTIATEFNPR